MSTLPSSRVSQQTELTASFNRSFHDLAVSSLVTIVVSSSFFSDGISPTGKPEILAPQLFWPVRSLREQVRRRARAGDRLFPTLAGSRFTDRLRSTVRRFGKEAADRLGTHSVTRGAAGAILAAGGSFAQLKHASGLSQLIASILISGWRKLQLWPTFPLRLRRMKGRGDRGRRGEDSPDPKRLGIEKPHPVVWGDF